MKIALIGFGAMARYVVDQLADSRTEVAAVILPADQIAPLREEFGSRFNFVAEATAAGEGIDLFVDCAGHGALLQHGGQILRAGHDLLTVSVGALADAALLQKLDRAAEAGGGSIRLVSGAIGALDALRAGRIGTLQAVRYIGRKPPQGWCGSPAEAVLDLGALRGAAQVHFRGTAREEALQYPKNANVAAAVALAGVGIDNTQVELLADPGISRNIHEIEAEGDFGTFRFVIEGTNDALMPALRRGAIDMVVGRLPTHRHRDEIAQSKLFDETIVAVTGPDHPLAGQSGLNFEDLKPYGWILPPPETSLRRQVDMFFGGQGMYAPASYVESVSFLTTAACCSAAR